MKLTDEEKRMLDGEQGTAVAMAMEMLLALGTIYNAEYFIPVQSAHVAGLSFKSHGLAGLKWIEDIADTGARVKVPTTLNVLGQDRQRPVAFPADWSDPQLRIGKAYEKLGCYGTSSCVPYYLGFVPRLHEHVAWAESSAIVYVNSVLGARTNREGGPSALAAGLTGRTPYYGLHITENRYGQIVCKLETPIRDLTDFGALGAYIGKRVGDAIPVLDGLGRLPSTEELVYFGAALASSGSVGMFHIVGVTPEAATLAAATGGKACESMIIGRGELEEGYEQLTSGKDRHVNLVAIGCPHCSLAQLAEVARLLEGKKVADGTALWVHANAGIKGMAEQLGYVGVIEEAGGRVTQDLCVVLSIPEQLGFTSLATNSPKMAFYAPGGNGLPAWFGSVERCITAAVSGIWS